MFGVVISMFFLNHLQAGEPHENSIEISNINSTTVNHHVKKPKKLFPSFNDQEKAWIKAHPVLKVGSGNDWVPFNFIDQHGVFNGITKDYLDLVEKISNLKIDLTVDKWSVVFEKFQQGQLDFLPAALYNKARETFGIFLKPHIRFRNFIYTRIDNDAINSFGDLDGTRLARVKEYAVLDPYLKNLHNITIIELDSTLELINAVLNGEADAFLEAQTTINHLIKENMISGLKSIAQTAMPPTNAHFLVKKSEPLLVSILQKTMDCITQKEHNVIFSQWLSLGFDSAYRDQQPFIQLSHEEKVYLRRYPTIRVSNEQNWPPFNFFEFGQPCGYSIDLMNLIANKTGLNVEYITGPNWEDFLQMARQNKIDVLLNTVMTQERQTFLHFSDPYFTPSNGIMIKKGDNSIQDFYDLLQDKTISVESGYYYHEYLKVHYPEIPLFLVNNKLEAIQAVAFGQADATVGSIPVFHYLQAKNHIHTLKIIEQTQNRIFKPAPLRIATTQQNPELLSILQKGLAAISLSEIQQLNDRWLGGNDSQTASVQLSSAHREWIKNHPVIHVGGETDWPPYDFVDESGQYVGLGKDYLDVVSKITGLTFEFHTGQTWKELLQSVRSGKLDLLPALLHSKEREEFLEFSMPYLTLADYYFTLLDYPKITNISDLYGKPVAMCEGYQSTEWLKKMHPQIKIVPAANILEMIYHVQSRKADTFLMDNPSTTYFLEKHFISDIVINNLVKTRSPQNLHMAVKKDYAPLAEILNTAIQAMPQKKRREIANKWMRTLEGELDLDDRERAWLAQKKTLTYAVDPQWKPIESINKKTRRYEGMMADLLEEVEKFSGITFKLIPTKSWNESVKLVKSGKVDFLPAVSKTPERKKYLRFSDTTIQLDDGVLVRSDFQFIMSLDGLKGMRVGVPSKTSVHTMLQKEHPNLILIPIQGTLQGIKQLSTKKIDAYVGNLEVIGYLINQHGFFNLKVALRLEKKRHLHIAIHKSIAPEPLSIINKALAEISDEKRNTIRQRWVGLKVTEGVDYQLLLKIGAGVLGILLIISFYNYRLKQLVNQKTADILRQKEELAEFNRNLESMVKERTQELQDEREFINSVMNSQTSLVVAADATHIRRANVSFLDFFGEEELKANKYEYKWIIELFNPDEEMLQKMKRNNQSILEFLLRNQGQAHKVEIYWKGINYIFSMTMNSFKFSDEELYTLTLNDITEIEHIRHRVENLLKTIQGSIRYASLIQGALIPKKRLFSKYFSDHFVIWHPRDVVGGDIYLFDELRHDDECLLMVIDCTGHGVPGAFVTMVVKAIERQIVTEISECPEREISPASILHFFNGAVKNLLNQEDAQIAYNAGFDGGVLYFNRKQGVLKYAGASTPLFYTVNGKIQVIKGDRQSIGYKKSDINFQFKDHTLDLQTGLKLYLTTDGYIDQSGGNKGLPFGKKKFKRIIQEYDSKPMNEQKNIFLHELSVYQKDLERRDDVTVIGLEI